MPSGYTRQSVAAIVNGNVINASDSNNEYNALLAAFNATTGHNHDGTTVGGGAPILAVNGVSYPNGASTNTVPVVTSSNVITYEAVPNAALVNSSITIGSTAFNLGDTHTSISGLTLSAPTITNATTSGLFTLGGNIAAGGFGIVGPTLNTATTSGTFTLGGGMTATGFTITGGTFSGPTLQSPALSGTASGTLDGGGTATLQNFILGTTITSGTFTLGATLNANTQSITNATLAGPTINNATIGSGVGTGSALGATLTITGQAIVGGGTGTIQATGLSANCTAVTASTADNSTAIATTAFVQNNLASYAPLASPVLTGNPTAPTQAASNSSTRLATTAYVQSQFNGSGGNNGWFQNGNGQPIFQWGRGTTSVGGTLAVTFPVEFGTACRTIQITMLNPSIPQALSSCTFSSTSITTSGFTLNANQNGAAAALPVTWFAVGI